MIDSINRNSKNYVHFGFYWMNSSQVDLMIVITRDVIDTYPLNKEKKKEEKVMISLLW